MTVRSTRLLALAVGALLPFLFMPQDAQTDAPTSTVHLSRFGQGDGPTGVGGTYRLLDEARTPLQSNAVAFDRAQEGAFERMSLRCRLRVQAGGDGGAFLFLNTRAYGARGPAPFVEQWVEPNLKQSFAVGIDVHNPLDKDPFAPGGNYQGLPEREVSLHWDGREIVKRVAPVEFRGSATDCVITVEHGVGGAEVTVELAGGKVYDRYFIADLLPYEARLAIGAGTRKDLATAFDVSDIALTTGTPASPRRPPLHVEVFNHVLTDNAKTAYETTVSLPPLEWDFGRVILTLQIHDAGRDWDEWDRNGEISIWDADGKKRGIVPFITSYRTPCHWKVDVTHFRPYLTGETRFEIRAGTNFYKNRGYMMSVALDFHHGSTRHESHPVVPYRVVPLWVGTARYKSAENHFQDFFTPQVVTIGDDVVAARVFTTTTGHSQIGEFTPSKRTLVFRPARADDAETRFENVLWKTDCYLNPNRPQAGTWKYARAGWAPGDVVRPWWVDLTPHLGVGEAVLTYEATPYEFDGTDEAPKDKQINEASHVVRSYLILYRAADTQIPAPTMVVMNVVADSNAAKAGMKRGDYLASYDGRTIDSVDDLRTAIQAATASGRQRVGVVVFRGLERLELELDVGRMGINLGGR